MRYSWVKVSEQPGGTVAALATAATGAGTTIVFAATAVGLFCSSDGGRVWAHTGSLPFVEAIVLSPGYRSDGKLFAGTRVGLYRSDDGGNSWLAVLTGSPILALASASGADGEQIIFAGTEADGVLRSDDGGNNWTGANAGLLDLTILALAVSPAFGQDRIAFAATASGLYRTRNGGKSWRELDLEFEEPGVQCLAISQDFAVDRLVLAGTEARGLLISRDGGGQWEEVPELARAGVTAVAFTPNDTSRPMIAAATGAGIVTSRDAGAHWQIAAQLGAPVMSLAFVAEHGEAVLLAGLYGRGLARVAEGTGWLPANQGLNAALLGSLALSPAFPDDRTIFVAGVEQGVSMSTDGGTTWVDRNTGLAGTTVFEVRPSANFVRDYTVYAATSGGIYHSQDGAASWQPLLASEDELGPALVVLQPGTLAAAIPGGELLVSEDSGAWHACRSPMEGATIIALALSPAYARDRTIFAATSRPVVGGQGADELVLWQSVDRGETWEPWLTAEGQSLLPLAISPAYAEDMSIFVAAGRHIARLSGATPQTARRDWRLVGHAVEVCAAPDSVTALAISPGYATDGTVVAATTAGVFVSLDRGMSFVAWSEGLDPPSIVALALSPDYPSSKLVYALGLGGTLWCRSEEVKS